MNRARLSFSRCKTIFYSVMGPVVLICLSPPGTVQANSLARPPQDSNCSDSIQSCKKPVKFISQNNGCYAFACEYGTATQRVIHARDVSDVKTLLQMGKESGN
jgi:hypothetical protein